MKLLYKLKLILNFNPTCFSLILTLERLLQLCLRIYCQRTLGGFYPRRRRRSKRETGHWPGGRRRGDGGARAGHRILCGGGRGELLHHQLKRGRGEGIAATPAQGRRGRDARMSKWLWSFILRVSSWSVFFLKRVWFLFFCSRYSLVSFERGVFLHVCFLFFVTCFDWHVVCHVLLCLFWLCHFFYWLRFLPSLIAVCCCLELVDYLFALVWGKWQRAGSIT